MRSTVIVSDRGATQAHKPQARTPMNFVVILLVFAVPMLELGLLIKFGQTVGFWWTMLLIIGTGALGAAIISHQGLSAPIKAQEAMRRGEAPVPKMFDSALAVLGGVLLITPGLIGDGLGLLLQVPLVRRVVGRWLVQRFFRIEDVTVERRPGMGQGTDPRGTRPGNDHMRPWTGTSSSPRGDGPVIEGEFERLDEKSTDPKRPHPKGLDNA